MIYRFLLALLLLTSILTADDEGIVPGDLDLKNAIPKQSLDIRDETAYLNGNLFSGTAVSRFQGGEPSSIYQYRDGIRHGIMISFYPNGMMELEASYFDGMLNGRFRGWDDTGDLLYDLWFDRGMLKQDLMLSGRMDEQIELEEDFIDSDGKDMSED